MARRKTKRSKSTKRTRKTKNTRQKDRKPLLESVSPERRIDIIGIILLLIGLLTLISLFSNTTGNVTGWWVRILSQAFGWGVYILPLALIGFGAWMLMRNLEKLPKLSAERVVGLILLFINLTAWFHLFINGASVEAKAGTGGGYVGAFFKITLARTLGNPGAVVVLIAWLLISLILTLDLALANIMKGLGELLRKLFDGLAAFIKERRAKKASRTVTPAQPAQTSAAKPKPVQSTETNSVQSAETAEQPTTGAGTPAGEVDQTSLYYNRMTKEPEWVLPDLDEILEPGSEPVDDSENDRQRARVIEETLRSFGAPAHVVDIRRGPAITLFGVEPDFLESRNGRTRVRVSKITSLADDLALALAAARIRIQAPVPGKGYIGIEVPNRQISLVSLRDIIRSPAYQNLNSPLKIALGKDVAGNPVAADLTAMPHLLIAGTTGAGKSVCINDILTCFLLNMTPDQLRLVLVDPKRVELTGYNGIPHLLSPVIVDAEHVVGALQWMMREMDNRYRRFSEVGARNIADYNALCDKTQEKKLPYLLVVIDELADLMMLAPDETERTITRLAQLARATGIHLIIATQRPSTDILTGLIKANFPARIAFAVASSVDSRVILDQPGAERLLGRGDMLFQAPDAAAPVRIQGAFVSDREIGRLASYWRGFTVSEGSPERPDPSAAFQTTKGVPLKQAPLWEEMEEENNLDPKFYDAVNVVREEGQASISMLQRKMRIGYTRSARMIEKMEERGIIGPPDPKTQIRDILREDEEK
ncbi:MAG: DNA translocase FtsK 4TM domain-containing protein [Chloroflexota bacterium]|nr:DNA translocase FtsK 4TM domain-containing protein [Chloroflexota bacterium]